MTIRNPDEKRSLKTRGLRMGVEQMQLVVDTWNKLGRSARNVSENFYERFFEQNPALKRASKFGYTEAAEKLTYMLSFAVINLRRPEETLLPAARRLGRLNAVLGVRAEHYDVAAAPLLWALQQALGADWTPEVESAWREFYTMASGALKQGAGPG
jgi:hemoglobin-like flavoprotein